jgi:hypothetical protein
MADNIPNLPGGALPPRPAEAKVQPKKETVRINLPPKPTAAPTIKLPTLPGGAPPPGAAGAAASTAATVALPTAAPKGPTVTTAGPAPAGPAPRTAGPATSTAQRPAPAPAAAPPRSKAVAGAATVSGIDKGLAIAAMLIALGSLAATLYLAFMVYQPAPGT